MSERPWFELIWPPEIFLHPEGKKKGGRESFDRWARGYDMNPLHLAFRFMEREVEKLINFDETSSLIDFGCGTGSFLHRVAARLAERRGKAVGVDPSSGMLRVARKKLEGRGVDLVRGEVEDLPFKDSSFDCGVTIQSFHHFTETERSIEEMKRVLRRGAALILCETTLDTIYERLYHRLILMREKRARRFPLDILEGMFAGKGFRKVLTLRFVPLIPVTILALKKV